MGNRNYKGEKMSSYKDLCSECGESSECRFWLDLLREENAEKIIIRYERQSTIKIVFACDDYKEIK